MSNSFRIIACRPNGGLIYCIKFLEKNMDWLKGKLKAYPDHYFIFDLPGQTELFVNNDSLLHIINTLTTDEDFKLSLVAVELFDSHYCYDASKFLSVCLYSLTSMINLSLPHINVLSKIDLLKEYGKLPMALKEYLVPDSVKEMIATDKSTSMFAQKYKQLTQKMGEVIDDYALVSFYPLDINDKISVSNLLALLDKANGYGYYMETVGTEKHFDLRNEVAKDDEFLESDRMVDLEEKLFFEQQEEEHERDMEYYRSLKDGKLPEDKA
eukprot:TRINITY_DN6651_c0_g1_i2.p1 TRINITY_DN6651_c0_g1~~TRINITY_DN6651_c0_g1_i2.p1  ORF type:complete len:268 (-),score=60.72 TRINITY_DN6651_c0_g1_i2:137-940(-)